jgi:hypothetical protein
LVANLPRHPERSPDADHVDRALAYLVELKDIPVATIRMAADDAAHLFERAAKVVVGHACLPLSVAGLLCGIRDTKY